MHKKTILIIEPQVLGHHKTGYLAEPSDSNDLAKGIEWVLAHKNYESLCQNAREKALKEFDSVVVAKKYIDLYRSMKNEVAVILFGSASMNGVVLNEEQIVTINPGEATPLCQDSCPVS